MSVKIHTGDCLDVLRTLPAESVNCCVTSPPYWGLRDYGVAGQIGQEPTPEAFVAKMVEVFAEVWRVLREDGTLWLNLGDSYAGGGNGGGGSFANDGPRMLRMIGTDKNVPARKGNRGVTSGLKPKDLIGIPWRVALALQADGWWLREDIIWAKANCMPESVTDRCTRSHEYIFHLAKSAHYYHDAGAIKEPCIYDVNGTGTAARKARQSPDAKSAPTSERAGIRSSTISGQPHGRHSLGDAIPERERRAGGYKNSVNFDGKNAGAEKQRGHSRRHTDTTGRLDGLPRAEQCTGMRNKRDVWTVAPANYPGAHFATFPPALIRPCILAGCPAGGLVLDPFGGSGTTGEVAEMEGRNSVLIELNPAYVVLARKRTEQAGLVPTTEVAP